MTAVECRHGRGYRTCWECNRYRPVEKFDAIKKVQRQAILAVASTMTWPDGTITIDPVALQALRDAIYEAGPIEP